MKLLLLLANCLLISLINSGGAIPAPNPDIVIQVHQVVKSGCNSGYGCQPEEVAPAPCTEEPITSIPAEITTEQTTSLPAETTPVPTTVIPTTIQPTTTGYCDTLRTIYCPDGSRCHANATCVLTMAGYTCTCANGYAGDGLDCGEDSDLDSWPDANLTCCEVPNQCYADNCPKRPNSGQEDFDHDGIGDACDTDKPPPVTMDPNVTPTIFCTPHKKHNCSTSDEWRTKDTDGDGHVDSCDNCPQVSNVDQNDTDHDYVGDACDMNQDTDKDGIDDGIDNCINIINTEQSDADYDGVGDECDDDADNDGILNGPDNCWLVPNPGQEDVNNDLVGDICETDIDGDCIEDEADICPRNPTIHKTDFRDFQNVLLDPSSCSGQDPPEFVSNDEGKEITQHLNSKPGLMFEKHHKFSGVNFKGTFFIGNNADDDYAGFIFGYTGVDSFYVVMWKKWDQPYWCIGSDGEAGLQLKRVHSTSGPSSELANALWATSNTTDQVTLLWHDSNKVPWEYDTSYRWELIHRPHIGLIRFRFRTTAGIIVDSGNIYDDEIKGGRLGVYCHSQEDITWSDLESSCNDHSVPQEVYDDLPSDKQAKIEVNPFMSWSGVVIRQKVKKIKTSMSNYEPGLGNYTVSN